MATCCAFEFHSLLGICLHIISNLCYGYTSVEGTLPQEGIYGQIELIARLICVSVSDRV